MQCENSIEREKFRMKFRIRAAACVLACAAMPAAAGEVLVAAAASLTNAFRDPAAQYETAHPGTKVLTTFGASDGVLREIVEGAPADLFASADQEAMVNVLAGNAGEPA